MEKKDTDKITAGFSIYDVLETETGKISSINPTKTLEKTLDRLSTGKFSFNPKIIQRFSKQTGLGFDPKLNAEGNVCLANHEDVRPEYRLNFGYIDLVDYLYAVLHEPSYKELFKSPVKVPMLPYPKDLAAFWQLVQKGRELRQNRLLDTGTREKFVD